MESLPLEITSNILLRLSVKTLGQLKCVSKTLKTLITSPYFTKTHHNQIPSAQRQHQLLLSNSSLHTLNIFHDNETLNIYHNETLRPLHLRIPSNPTNNYCGATHELVGSCNGLVCLYYPPNTYTFLNPTTRELRVLPNPDARVRMYGFGYVSKFDDYMVVSIGSDESVVRVFSGNADSWKTVQTRVPLPVLPWAKPVYVNNVVHWLGFDDREFKPLHNIMGFDFVDEQFKMLPLCEILSQRLITALGVLEGCVCVLSRARVDTDLDMWVMMEYGIVESWTQFILSLPDIYPNGPLVSVLPICYVGFEILFMANSRTLVLYDLVEGTNMIVEVELQEWEGQPDAAVAVYEESLVSPYHYICQDQHRRRG